MKKIFYSLLIVVGMVFIPNFAFAKTSVDPPIDSWSYYVDGTQALNMTINWSLFPYAYAMEFAYNLDGGVYQTFYSSNFSGSAAPSGTVSFVTSSLSIGTHTVQIRAIDSMPIQIWTYSSISFSVAATNPCPLPWGGTITSGTSATTYLFPSVVSPATCTSQVRTCTNGTLSGTYTNQACSVTAALAVPTVTTPTVTSITTSGATLGARVTSLGNPATITSRGTCWGTTTSPTTNCVSEGGTTTGIFTHSQTGMTVNTTYYYRGYATNSTGTGYSADGTFTTALAAPTVTTPTVASITTSGAKLGARVTSLGNPATITDRGTCWGTTASPITNCVAATGVTTGIFTHARTGMIENTLYYYRGYATNSTGTGYSADGTFTTLAAAIPTVTTPTVASITTSGAKLGARVTSLGNPATITDRGTCWGTTASPITNCVAATGVTTGIFTHARTGMTANTTYYYRGYATNSTGTGYSADGSFTTLGIPTVTTPTVASITTSSATLGADVASLGNPATITARGTCWGTTASPITNCVAEGGTTTGIFTHARTGLTASTLYYYRGYADNSTGRGYSADSTFTTSIGTPTTPTISGPTTLITGHSGTYSFVSTDPQGDQVRYGIDWNMDGTADNWLPVFPNYVDSGIFRSMDYTWSTTGSKQFQALAQDYPGNNSAWTTYTITVSDPQPCTAGVVDSSGSWAPTCSTSATCLTPPSPAQLTNQPGIQIGLCPTPEYTGNAYRSCSTATITCTLSTFCGDSTCNGSETLLTCPADCKARYQQF